MNAAVRAVLEGAWARERTPAFTQEIVARSLDNRDKFYNTALQNPSASMLQSMHNAQLLTRVAAGDHQLSVRIPPFKPRRYRRYLARNALFRPQMRRAAFDAIHFPLFVRSEAQYVRAIAIQEMRASLLVALAHDVDRAIAPHHVQEHERIALARKIVAVPLATAAAAAAMLLPIPGSGVYAGYQTYRVIAGGHERDVFEEGQWWRESRTDHQFRKCYRRLVRGVKPILIEATAGGKAKQRKVSYRRHDVWDLMRVLYFTQPDAEFIRANMAVEYYNTMLLKTLRYFHDHPPTPKRG